MKLLRGTDMLTAVTALLLITGVVYANDEEPKGQKNLLPPSDIYKPLFPVGGTLTPTSAIIQWIGPPEANNFIVTIFKVENEELILHEEIKNVHEERFEFEDLEPSTNYEVLIKSVRVHLDGTTDTSDYSNPYSFTTLEQCKGGMSHVQCTAHCIPSCERPRPACDRRCVPGCKCPREQPYLHDGQCIAKSKCKSIGAPLSEVLGRPTDLKLHRMKASNDLLFTWSAVEGADFYVVTVMKKSGEVVQKIDNVKIPFLIIKGLKPKVPYRFKVKAKFYKFKGGRRGLTIGIPKPDPPKIAQVKETSFYAQWNDYPGAEDYKLVVALYKSKEPLQVFKNLKEMYITIQGLSPGTRYDVSIIVVTASKDEIESEIEEVKTDGEKDDDSDYHEPTEITYIVEPITTTTTQAPTTTPYIPTCTDRKHALEAFLEDNPDSDQHIPDCDSDGNFRSRQCENQKGCYCVDKRTGDKRDGSDFENPSSEFALNCGRYGDFNIPAIEVKAAPVDTESIKIRWKRHDDAVFYIVKVYNGFEGGLFDFVSGLKKPSTVVSGLSRGSPYVVVVVAVDKDGRTSKDNVKGAFVATPHLNPPTDVKLEQVDDDKMKVSWTKSDLATHYKVEVFEGGNEKSRSFENVTEDHVIFTVKGTEVYKVSVMSTGVTTIPGSGEIVSVSSNSIQVSRRPTCAFPILDILFVIDISGQMSPEEYKKAKSLFVKLTQSLTPLTDSLAAKTGTRIAAVKAYSVARTMFRYNRFSGHSGVISAINYVKQAKSKTLNLGRTLDYIYRTFFSSANNDDQRKNVETAVISFPGGPSNDKGWGIEAARLRSVTNVFTVGVEDKASEGDVIVSSPSNFRIMIPSYDDVQEAHDIIMSKLCNLK